MTTQTHSSMRRGFSALALGVLLLLAGNGCRKEEARSYRAPKTPVEASPQMAETEPVSQAPRIDFRAPSDWREQPPRRMRVANFTVPGTDTGGGNGEVAVVALPGAVASEVNFINMWRQELQLPPLDESGLASAAQPVRIGDVPGKLFDMSGDTNVGRVLVAMTTRSNTVWLVKLSGPDALVTRQQPDFIRFLDSIRFRDDIDDLAEAPRTGRVSTNEGEVPSTGPKRPDWEVPAAWKEQKAGTMRLASFLVTDPAGAADVSVTVLSGTAGGALANVNRWRQQIALEAIAEAELKRLATPLDPKVPAAILVDMTGTEAQRKQRILAAIVPREGATWFYKMIGDESVVNKQRDAFVAFVQSAKYEAN